MKLIDTSPIIEKYINYEYFSGYEDFDEGVEAGVLSIIDELKNASEIDPIHAANACYCKECWYYTEWGECKEFGDIMKPDEFCSRGVMKNGKTY